MMKRLGLLALTLFLCTPAHSETGSALLQACEALEREIRISGNNIQLQARTDVHRCWGYMGAVQDFSVIVMDDQTGKPLLNSCPGPNTTLTQLIRVFTNYARTHPEELHEKASLLVYRAMLSAFPCP
jgi:Rap1a immunity proteins